MVTVQEMLEPIKNTVSNMTGQQALEYLQNNNLLSIQAIEDSHIKRRFEELHNLGIKPYASFEVISKEMLVSVPKIKAILYNKNYRKYENKM